MTDLWPTLHKAAEKIVLEDCYEGHGPMCPSCEDDEELDTESGTDVICRRCGTIVDTPLEWAAEYRWHSSESSAGAGDPSRCGFPVNPLMPESSLGTIILSRGRGSGSKIMHRIKRYHGWNLMPYRERTLWSIFDGLQIRAMNAGINTAAIEEAKELFAQLTATAKCRGQGQRDAMLAACLWEALKRHDTPRMPKDIAEIFTIPLRNTTRGIKQFQHLLAVRMSSQKTDTYAGAKEAKVKVKEESKEESKEVTKREETDAELTARAHLRRAICQKTVARTTTYEDFIQPFLTNLSVGRTSGLESLVRHVCQRTEELGVVPENTPPSLTASVIAFCCESLNISISIPDIASVCGISAVTIQKCIKRMKPLKEKLLEK